jgi:hypothetical protein
MEGTANNPAFGVQVWRRSSDDGKWESTDTVTVHREPGLRKLDGLPSKAKYEKAQDLEVAVGPTDMYDIWGDLHPQLSYRQIAQYGLFQSLINDFGMFAQDAYADGAHYSSESPFAAQGICCENCVFYEQKGECQIVAGMIEDCGVCKLWIIPDNLIDDTNTSQPMGQ